MNRLLKTNKFRKVKKLQQLIVELVLELKSNTQRSKWLRTHYLQVSNLFIKNILSSLNNNYRILFNRNFEFI